MISHTGVTIDRLRQIRDAMNSNSGRILAFFKQVLRIWSFLVICRSSSSLSLKWWTILLLNSCMSSKQQFVLFLFCSSGLPLSTIPSSPRFLTSVLSFSPKYTILFFHCWGREHCELYTLPPLSLPLSLPLPFSSSRFLYPLLSSSPSPTLSPSIPLSFFSPSPVTWLSLEEALDCLRTLLSLEVRGNQVIVTFHPSF